MIILQIGGKWSSKLEALLEAVGMPECDFFFWSYAVYPIILVHGSDS